MGHGIRLALVWALTLPTCRAVWTLVEHLSRPRGLALDIEAGKMYWAEVGVNKLRRANLNGTQVTDIVVKAQSKEAPYGVAIDTEGGKVYWTSQCCSIRRANLDGSEEEDVVIASNAGGIALDTMRNKLYWTDWMLGRIWRVNYDGTEKEAIVSAGLSSPVDVALDIMNAKVYWSDLSRGRIERANLDGSSVEALNVSWAIIQTNGIVLDTKGKKIYLTDYTNNGDGDYKGRIHRADLDGGNSEILVSGDGLKMPFSVAVDNTRSAVYWTDQQSGKIQRLALRCMPGTLAVATPTNATIAYVSHGGMLHGKLAEAACPPGFQGSVSIACNDGFFYISSGQCALNCPRGSYSLANGGSAQYPDMEHGQTAQASCPEGQVGPLQVTCNDGKVAFSAGACVQPRPCNVGKLLVDTALVAHDVLQHLESVVGRCPDGFEGNYVAMCNNGNVVVQDGGCRAYCSSGSVWVDGGNVEVQHGAISLGKSINVICPARSAGDGVSLTCSGGFLDVNGTCRRTVQCPAGLFHVSGVQVAYDTLDGRPSAIVECPKGFSGSLELACDGGVRLVSGGCFADCTEGWALDRNFVPVRHSGGKHGEYFPAMCPAHYSGSIPMKCNNGNATAECNGHPECACHVAEEGTDSLPVVALAAPVISALVIGAIAVVLYRKGVCKTSSCSTCWTMGLSRDLCEEMPNPLVMVSVDSFIPSPAYWATREGVHIYQDPNRIKEVQDLMTDTWRRTYTRDRRLIAGQVRVPVGCRVVNVLRVENHKAYDKYWQHKANLREKHHSGCEPFHTLTRNRLNDLDDGLNERYLFHGTNPEAAHAIARDEFHIDKAGSCAGTMFGPGIYLAENASKSDEYAKEGGGVYLGLCALLVCRALMGKVLVVSTSRDCSGEVKRGEYDCVCGDRLAAAGTFRELVFFTPEALYPEFIVIYARVYGDD